MFEIDTLCYHSKLRERNAEIKFAFTVLTLFICVWNRSIVIAAIVFATTGFLTVCVGGIPATRYIRLLCIPFFFLLLSTLTVVINFSKTPLSGYAICLGTFYITAGKDTILFAVQIFCTAFGAVSCLYFLSLSTPMTDLIAVLERLHCPSLFIELMLLIYRFLFVLAELASSISTAQKARLGNRNFRTSFSSFGALLSVPFRNRAGCMMLWNHAAMMEQFVFSINSILLREKNSFFASVTNYCYSTFHGKDCHNVRNDFRSKTFIFLL